MDRNYDIEFVNAYGILHGETVRDSAHITCAELLKKIGAKHLRHTQREVVEIYFGVAVARFVTILSRVSLT